MFMAKEARKHKLGPLHPAYNLLQIVKDCLQRGLPEDAHIRASGKLCVSLTRVSDGKNVLVSEFDSREELVQHYVDGAVSDNLPRCHLKNTITFSAYAGESDVCPRGSTLNFHEVRFNNVSIQVDTENMYRVASTFFPPEPEAMAEICQNGYVDALRFLQENNLISSECPLRSLETDIPKPVCCELAKEPAEAEESNEDTQQKGLKAPRDEHWWLDPQLIERLPVNLKKALCEACRETRTAGGLLSQVTELLPDKVTSYLRIPCTLPVESACSLAQRLVDWIPDVPRDMSWFYGVAGDIYKKAWKVKVEDCESEVALHRSTSMPLGLNLWNNRKEDVNALPLTPETTPTSSLTFTWNTNTESDHVSLTPPPTPTFCPEFGEATVESPKSAGCGFRSIYYLGALSCILERVPQLVQGASKICGASSGCLVAAALTVGFPIEQLCVDVLTVAKEARKHTLGVFHPTFSLLRTVRDSLLEKLPQDAHLRASGKLCVSLTRLTDGKNVLHYMDGALSNNMPMLEQRNTITMAPFSGESDICPREGTFNFVEVHYGNVSIQVNTGNVHRVYTSFLPPRIEKLAEICNNGYVDALRFLGDRDLLGTQCLPPSLVAATDTVKPACCRQVKESTQAQESRKMMLNGLNSPQEEHRWLDVKVIENLPVSLKKGQNCSSFSSGSDLRNNNKNIQSLISTLTPNSQNLRLDDLLSLTSTCSSPSNLLATNTSTSGKLTLNHRSKQTHHQP
eukprot:superscaffoldBa00000535_g5472